ncbi:MULTISPECIES: DUF4434 domain-containing protein [Bacteria]|uniref:DUF4434 domain-containing protein n=1 Tax=Bacteria TaxID=2 RepID=UPI003C7B9AE4
MKRRSVRHIVAALVAGSLAFGTAPVATAATTPDLGVPTAGPVAAPGRIGATHLDPYSVFNASSARLDALFRAQKAAGIDTVIVQWTGALTASGVVTTYPASASTGFGAWDTVLPRLLASAKQNGVTVWLGLVLKSSLLDLPGTRADAALLDRIARDDVTLAADLLSKYPGQFAGWYIPTEPGYATIADPALTALHSQHLKKIVDGLDALPSTLDVMVSPSVPRAIEGGLSGVEFVSRLAPLIEDTGVDVWNLQDGYKMTAWTPAQNRALIEKGKELAAPAGAEVWATIYTPGPGEANGPVDPVGFFEDLDTVSATGAPVTIWTFVSAMDPDPTRSHAVSRQILYGQYRTHIDPPAP